MNHLIIKSLSFQTKSKVTLISYGSGINDKICKMYRTIPTRFNYNVACWIGVYLHFHCLILFFILVSTYNLAWIQFALSTSIYRTFVYLEFAHFNEKKRKNNASPQE